MASATVIETISGHKIDLVIDPVGDLGIKPGADGLIGLDYDYTLTVRVQRNHSNPQKGLLGASVTFGKGGK